MTRYELRMGYHSGIVEWTGPSMWSVTISSPLVQSVEGLYYSDGDTAVAGCRQVLQSIQDAEDSFRNGWTRAYLTAVGRESDPYTPGPQWSGSRVALGGEGTLTAVVTVDAALTGDGALSAA